MIFLRVKSKKVECTEEKSRGMVTRSWGQGWEKGKDVGQRDRASVWDEEVLTPDVQHGDPS